MNEVGYLLMQLMMQVMQKLGFTARSRGGDYKLKEGQHAFQETKAAPSGLLGATFTFRHGKSTSANSSSSQVEPRTGREPSQRDTTNLTVKTIGKEPNTMSETAAAGRGGLEKTEKEEYMRRIRALQQENSKARDKITIMTKKMMGSDADLHRAQDKIASQEKLISQDRDRLQKFYVSAASMLTQDVSRDITDDSIRTTLGSILQDDLLSWCADMCTRQVVDKETALRVLGGCDIFNYLFSFNLPNGRSTMILLQAALAKFLCWHFLTNPYFLASDPVGLLNFERNLATTSLAMSMDWRIQTVHCLEASGICDTSFLAQEFEATFDFLLENMDDKAREDLNNMIHRFAQVSINLWKIRATIEVVGVTRLAKAQVKQQDEFIECEPHIQFQLGDPINEYQIGAVARPLILAHPVSEKVERPVVWSKALVWVTKRDNVLWDWR